MVIINHCHSKDTTTTSKCKETDTLRNASYFSSKIQNHLQCWSQKETGSIFEVDDWFDILPMGVVSFSDRHVNNTNVAQSVKLATDSSCISHFHLQCREDIKGASYREALLTDILSKVELFTLETWDIKLETWVLWLSMGHWRPQSSLGSMFRKYHKVSSSLAIRATVL